ncbi:MAG: hypothetical protein ACREBQ_12940 [Nitrososphaerales archaeon]
MVRDFGEEEFVAKTVGVISATKKSQEALNFGIAVNDNTGSKH